MRGNDLPDNSEIISRNEKDGKKGTCAGRDREGDKTGMMNVMCKNCLIPLKRKHGKHERRKEEKGDGLRRKLTGGARVKFLHSTVAEEVKER